MPLVWAAAGVYVYLVIEYVTEAVIFFTGKGLKISRFDRAILIIAAMTYTAKRPLALFTKSNKKKEHAKNN